MIESTARSDAVPVAGGASARRYRRLALWAAAGAAIGIGASWHPLSPVCVFVAGGLITLAVAGRDPFLRRTALAAYGVRVALTVGFFVLSTHPTGALHSVLTRPVEGYRFWIFSLDSPSYHAAGVKSMLAWRYGTEFPDATGPEYFIFTGLAYFLLGTNPLNVILWNSAVSALTVIIGYRMSHRVAGEPAARVAGVLIAFWPSSLIWSTQLLKDSICLFLTFTLLYLTMLCVERPTPLDRRGRLKAFARWVGLVAVVFVAALFMYRFRNHVFLFLIPAPAIFVLVALLQRGRGALWQGFAAGVLVVVMIGAVSAGRRIDLEAIFAPRHPEIGHLNRGVAFQAVGNLDAAEAQYIKALKIRPDYPPALRNMVSILIARGQRLAATELLKRYLKLEPRDRVAAALMDPLRRGVEVVSLLPVTVAVERRPLHLTGSHSDYVTGNRKYPLDDVVMAIAAARMGYTSSGGHSMIDPEVRFRSASDILRYLPRAIANLFLTPYPWQWFDLGGSTGPFKALSAIEAVLLYVLVIPLLLGAWTVLKARSGDALYLVFFIASTGLVLALVVSNLGTLFRLRLEFLLPFFTVVSPGLLRLFAVVAPRRLIS